MTINVGTGGRYIRIIDKVDQMQERAESPKLVPQPQLVPQMVVAPPALTRHEIMPTPPPAPAVLPVPAAVVTPAPAIERVSDIAAGGSEWGWRELNDYVGRQIEQRFGPFPRNPAKESGIFKAFIGRWGSDQAQAIARYAFEVCDGYWKAAPISISRFAKGSDPYFAQVISERISTER